MSEKLSSPSVPLSEWLRARFPEGVLATHQQAGDDTAVVRRESLRVVAQALRDEPELAFNVLMDLTAVDYREGRFEVVYHFYSLARNRRLRLKVPVEAHLIAQGKHAFNMGDRSSFAAVKNWPQRMAEWMQDRGYLKPAGAKTP